MKRHTLWGRLAPLLFLFASVPASAALNVFACEPEWQALVKEIGGDTVTSFSATTAFQDPHHIEARPSLIAKMRRADLVICTGAELEIAWLPLLLRQSGNAKIQEGQPGYFIASDQVTRLDILEHVDRSQGDVHAQGNPHVHLDPHRLLAIAKKLTVRLQNIDPDNSASYEKNGLTFNKRWQQAISQWESAALPLKGKSVIVYHQNWRYLLDWLDIEVVADMEPKPGLPPTSRHLAELLSITQQQPVDAILYASYQNDRAAKWLRQRTGIKTLELPFTVGGNKESGDLFALMDNTIRQLLSMTQ